MRSPLSSRLSRPSKLNRLNSSPTTAARRTPRLRSARCRQRFKRRIVWLDGLIGMRPSTVFHKHIKLIKQIDIHRGRRRTSLCGNQLPLPRSTPFPRLRARNCNPNPPRPPHAFTKPHRKGPCHNTNTCTRTILISPPCALLPLLRNPLHIAPLRPRPAVDLGLANPQIATFRPPHLLHNPPASHRKRPLPVP